MEAKPHQEHVWHPVREATWLHRKQLGHRGQTDQDQRHQVHEATLVQEGFDEAYRVHGRLRPIHQPAR